VPEVLGWRADHSATKAKNALCSACLVKIDADRGLRNSSIETAQQRQAAIILVRVGI
jgi:hypothetical protein